MGFRNSPATEMIGTILCRGVVPLWVLTGAVFKLIERTPRLLPSNIVKCAIGHEMDLDFLLRTLIGLEFFAVAVMLFMPRVISRVMTVLLLAGFCAILVGEIAAGASSCGCMGKVTLSPWTMLAIDGTLLALVLIFACRRRPAAPAQQPVSAPGSPGVVGRIVATVAAVLLGFGIAFGVPAKQADVDIVGPTPAVDEHPKQTPAVGEDPKQTPVVVPSGPGSLPLPKNYIFDQDAWKDQRWEDLKIARFMKVWPKDVNIGRRYVIFYSRTCDHCHTLFDKNFRGELAIPTTVVAIPEETTGFNTTGVLSMPCTSCEKLELPIGPFWFATPPIIVALEDGKVICAKQIDKVEDPKGECLPWEP
jgi:hypothetical protein